MQCRYSIGFCQHATFHGAGKLCHHECYLYKLSNVDGEQHDGTGEHLHLLLVQVLQGRPLETG